jgi:CHAD domain-containing protein
MHQASVLALRLRHEDILEHSEHVSRLAADLFVGSAEAHRLGPQRLRLVLAGARLHNVALVEHPTDHHLAGRDMVVAEGLRGYTDQERAVVACIVAFHCKRVHPDEEPLWMAMPPDLQRDTLACAALVRAADGLDHNYAQSSHIARVRGRKRVRVYVRGKHPRIDSDVRRALKKADLWERVVGAPLAIVTTRRPVEPWHPPVAPGQTLARSMDIVLRGYLAQAVATWGEVAAFDGVDARHDVRVGLRRFRSGLRLYRRRWPEETYDGLMAEIRWFGDVLGAVRDGDLELQWLRHAAREMRSDVSPDLGDLIRRAARGRREKMRALVDALRSDRVERLLDSASDWMAPGADTRVIDNRGARTLRTEAPRVLRRSAERIRTYERSVDEAASERLHELRRECRRMRYAAEAWYLTLSKGRRRLVQRLIAVQDDLGDIHDADVRMGMWTDQADPMLADKLCQMCDKERRAAWGRFLIDWPELLKDLSEKRLARMLPE